MATYQILLKDGRILEIDSDTVDARSGTVRFWRRQEGEPDRLVSMVDGSRVEAVFESGRGRVVAAPG